MFLSFPFSYGFGLLCLVGSLLSISCGDWLGVWLGLEVNLLGFIPLMVQGTSGQSVESAIKYFVVQALGSGMLLFGGVGVGESSVVWFLCNDFSFFAFFCFIGLVLKLGVAPLHWWIPSVMGGLGWFSCGFLVTWQKLAPFLVLLGMGSIFSWLLLLLGCVSSVWGGVMGIGQVQVRILMSYSSISHWGWIVGVMGLSSLGSLCYFFFYFCISFFLFYFFGCYGGWRVGHVLGVSGFFLLVGLLSLGGLPPLTGFVPKWVGVQVVSGAGLSFLLLFLLLGSVLSLYYYLSFLFVFFVGGGSPYSSDFRKFFLFLVPAGLCFFALGLPFYEVLFFVV